MARRPPDFRRQIVALVAERRDRDREEDRFPDRGSPWSQALLARLVPEGGEVGRQDHAGDDIRLGSLESSNLGRKIVREILVAARIGEFVAELVEDRGEADLLVAPGIAVAVIGK